MTSIFRNRETDEAFRLDGYVTAQLLAPEDIRALLDLHRAVTPELTQDFFATLHNPDAEHRRRGHHGIIQIIRDKVRQLIYDYEFCLATFLTKKPLASDAEVGLHQDISLVDPADHIGIDVWCPLVDVDENNGCLKVVKGSHLLLPHIVAVPRGTAQLATTLDLLDSEYARHVPLAAGSAVFYDSRLVHGSDGNRTDAPRIAFSCAMIPTGVSPRIYFGDEQKPANLEVYEVSDDFLLNYTFSERPDGATLLDSIDYPIQPLQPEDLAALPRSA